MTASEVDRRLVVLIDGRRAGVVVQGDDGRVELNYEDQWRSDLAATPLSLSMPLVTPIHGDAVVHAFLSGLLPDSEEVLERWARRSVLLSEGHVRLAPLYDVASALPYDEMYVPKLRMAMRIGGEYRLAAISDRHWRRFAEANGLDPDATIERIDYLATQTPDALGDAVKAPAVRALGSELPTRLLDRVSAHTRHCRKALAR